MFRLRTTTTLSLLALAVGVAGTAWLSEQTAGWKGPERIAARRSAAPAVPAHPRLAAVPRRPAHAVHLPPVDAEQAIAAPAAVDTPTLTPIEMPQAPSSIFSRRVARAGLVVLHLSVDGQGHVTHATVDQSSGDPALDQEAVQTVQGWRFAVPADHPEGLSGNLPMRFAADDRQA
ncbi:protein TonB [Dyella sp. SG562]|jgi:protein TonB|uniref:energy transducer TonB family protein n=1 Tax=Dyella sp. SG562 TaxID=2587017 RepID=UPI00141F3CFE|nr:energy transducer TonB [Dyella sp. SG562]NII72168.1 protein TonB [Dyella sp. SG562]